MEEGKGIRNEVEYVDGMQFDRGYISPYFVTDPDRMEAVVEDPYILITDMKVSAVNDILPLLEKALKVSKSLVLIASDVDGEALATLAVNKLRGTLNVIAVKAPGFGDRQKDNLGDIAVLTGGTVVSEQLGTTLETADISALGRARRFIATKEDSTIIDGKGDPKEIDARITQIKAVAEQTKSDWDKEKALERMGKLSNSVAVIKVGAATEVELKEKKHRVEDALSATRAAVEEGIVSGGGVALLSALPAIEKLKLEGDEATGVRILLRAMEEPMRRIAINAGQDGSVVLEAVRTSKKKNWGYDASSGTYGDLVSRGIIDPAMVTRAALENAVSIGAMVLTTNCLVAEKPDDKSNGAAAPPPSMY